MHVSFISMLVWVGYHLSTIVGASITNHLRDFTSYLEKYKSVQNVPRRMVEIRKTTIFFSNFIQLFYSFNGNYCYGRLYSNNVNTGLSLTLFLG